jgi:hypothetical protein
LYKLLPMVYASGWLRAHKSGERSLVQVLKGDPTYLIVTGYITGCVRPETALIMLLTVEVP